ncbi:cofactor of BRCA1-domain-containing protein [Gamsiella multidivaricata]|uniref:cofactor of BRCA1-domain-containing protein n=1 Tax=Gamsiella multidivaricata TaxID=101098 RepID=UPI0022208ACA|nr:cofactor of BRCA1-domain-containing protein [Gamsiella multidivaricata]KAI7830362.1 cofactor of BRCA1-domain-containing protein [Gamsiella multidivaricata]
MEISYDFVRTFVRCIFLLPGIDALYPLLDQSGKSRYEIHSSCMRALKAKLLQRLETVQMDNAKFDSALEQMLPYIDVEGLQELPLTLLGRFPDRMTKDIIDKIGGNEALFKIAPKEVQRRIWLSNSVKFRDDVIPIVQAYRTDPEVIRMAKEMSIDQPTKVITQRRNHPSIKQLLDILGGNLELYNQFGSYLRSLFIRSNEAVYCTLRFDLLMAMHEENVGSVGSRFTVVSAQITKVDPCHELVWNLDACNRTLSMDERRVDNIRKFFDKVNRDDPVHGDIAMILNDPFTSNMITSRLLVLLNEATQNGRIPQSDPTLTWTATMLNLGAHARRIIQNQKFRIPKVEANVSDKFMTTLSNCILDDTLGMLKQDVDENVEYEEVEFTEDNLVALDDSEVARKILCHYILDKLSSLDIHALARTLPTIVNSLKRNSPYDYQSSPADSLHVTYQSFFHSFLGMLLRQTQLTRFLMARKWQTVIMNEFLVPAAAVDVSVHGQAIEFLLEAFRLVASSGRAGSIGDAFLNMGRWLETLCMNRPIANITQEKDYELRETYAKIVADVAMLSGGRYKMKPEDITNVLAYVQACEQLY